MFVLYYNRYGKVVSSQLVHMVVVVVGHSMNFPTVVVQQSAEF